MNTTSRTLLASALTCVTMLGLRSHAAAGTLADKPLAGQQGELLDVAMRAATALPIQPHIKTRSRAQEAVVAACLELDQPLRASSYSARIDDWRRGTAYADLAFYAARHEDPGFAQRCLELAEQVSQQAEHENAQNPNGQGWRRDRIRVSIAKTYLCLGQPKLAAESVAGVVEAESGQLRAVEAMLVSPEGFDAQVEALASSVAMGGFDQVRNALEAYAQLYRRFYADATRRALVEKNIKATWGKLPVTVRIELLVELAEVCLANADSAKAAELVHEARFITDTASWAAQDQVPLLARLAGLRHRAGEREPARRDAEAALALYDRQRDKIVDIYRASALRPLAEAYQSMGDGSAAVKLYERAIEEGVQNPNSKPRAEDLSATCCSMARSGVELDPQVEARLREICAGLSDPW